MRYEIDLRGVETKAQFHDRVQQALPCPAYYGRNLDAFYDVLTGQGEAWELCFVGFEDFVQAMPGYGAALNELCEEAAEECPGLEIVFTEGQGY